MRIQLIIGLLMAFSMVAIGDDDKSMKELFDKYDKIMFEKKMDLIDEVFTKDFIQGSGGKKDLIDKIMTLKEVRKKRGPLNWHKGIKANAYFAKFRDLAPQKDDKEETQFIIYKEDGKLKIDGTLSDGP